MDRLNASDLLDFITNLVALMTLWMIFRASWLSYLLFRDYKDKASRAFGYFFVGLTLGALRALIIIPLLTPPLWNLIWQFVSYSLIVLGLELIYREIRHADQ